MSKIFEIYLMDLENKKIPVSETYSDIYNNTEDLFNELKKELTEKQNDKLIKLYKLTLDISVETEKTAYIAGFKSGLELAVEALINSEE